MTSKFLVPISLIPVGFGYFHHKNKKPLTVVWDLDNTLMQNYKSPLKSKKACTRFTEIYEDENKKIQYYIYPRFGAKMVIQMLDLLGVEQNIYTASTRKYMENVLYGMDIEKYMKHTLSREDTVIDDDFIKKHRPDISIDNISDNRKRILMLWYKGKDIKLVPEINERSLLVDDRKMYHQCQKEKGILIPECDIKNEYDSELLSVFWTILKCMYSDVDEFKNIISEDGYSPFDLSSEKSD